jgi:PAS domain S-box-containing protein
MDIRADFHLLANILDHAPVLLCAVGPHGQLQYVSRACQHLLGQECDALVGQAFANIVHPEDRADALAACARALEQDGPVLFESRSLNATGGEVVVEWSAFRPPADALLLCIGHDVTKQREAARHTLKQEAYHQAVAEHGFDMMALLDAEGRYLHVGGSITSALGYRPEELVGHSAFDFVHPEDVAAAQASWNEQGHQPSFTVSGYRFRAASGEWRWMESSVGNQLLNPEIRAYTVVSRDVTEQRQAARREHEQEEFYRAVAEHGFDIMSLMSTEGLYTYVSGSAQKTLGYLPEQMLGHSPLEFMHPDDVAQAQAALGELGTQPVVTVPDCRFRAANGEWHYMETTISNQLLNPAIRAYTLCSRDVTDKKNRAFELAASEQRFRLLFENNQNPAIFQDVDGRVLDVNPACLGLLKTTKEQLMNQQLVDFIPAGVSPNDEERFRVALSGQSLAYNSTMMVDGMERIFAVTKAPLVVEGRIIGVNTTGLEITEMVAAQQLIKQQAARLHMVLESITDVFITMDRDWNLTYINSEGERLLNISQDAALGKNMWKLFPEEAGGIYRQKYQQALDTGQTVRFEAFFDRENRWLELKGYPFAEGITVIFCDITKRVESDKQLKTLALVAKGTVNSVVITDAQGRTEWVNEAFTRDTGYTLAEVLGQQPGAVLQGPETDPAAIQRFQERLPLQKPFSATILNYKKSGQRLWFSMDITPIFNDMGELTQYIAIQQNINFRKEIEASQAKMTQDLYRHNRDLQQFTYVISHNLRAPLANALGLATVLTKVDKNSDVFEMALTNLRQSMVQADAVLKDLNLVLSIRDKKDMQALEPLALKEVCEQALNNMDEALQQCGGRVMLDVEDHLMTRGIRAYLYSIFYNLLSNSIKYRSAERPLQVDIDCYTGTHGGPTITFTDNGSGFDMFKAGSDVFQLYKRFHTNQRGRGIGLFLVKTHVEAMGGKIEVTSEVSFGTRFTIHLDKR